MFSLSKTLERCIYHMSAWSLRNTLAFRSDYDFRTVFKLSHYCSINLDCCINTWEYLILTIKENCQTNNYGKFGKKLLLWNYVPFLIDILAFELGKLFPRVGILFRFYYTGALKSCPRAGILTRKINGPGVAPRGVVTGQRGICITLRIELFLHNTSNRTVSQHQLRFGQFERQQTKIFNVKQRKN